MQKNNTHIGLQIKKIRLFKGLNQDELADKIFKTRALVSYMEQTGKVSKNTLEDILKVFTMSEHEFNQFAKTDFKYEEFENLKKENLILKERNSLLEELVITQRDLIYVLKKPKQKL